MTEAEQKLLDAALVRGRYDEPKELSEARRAVFLERLTERQPDWYRRLWGLAAEYRKAAHPYFKFREELVAAGVMTHVLETELDKFTRREK